MHEQIRILNLNIDEFNIFGASCEELAANALDEANLVKPVTTINGLYAKELCKSYELKKENFKESTKLGSLLVRYNIITQNQLEEALDYQKKNSNLKIGAILINFNFCTIDDIERFLITQLQIQKDIKELDEFMNKITVIKERLKTST